MDMHEKPKSTLSGNFFLSIIKILESIAFIQNGRRTFHKLENKQYVWHQHFVNFFRMFCFSLTQLQNIFSRYYSADAQQHTITM